MEAFISARARLAGIVDGNEAWLLSQRWGFERREVRINELRRLFSIYSDTIFLSDVSEERVVHVAKLEAARDECLALALVVLNPAEDEEFRLGAAKCLDGLLQDPIYEEYLVNLLSSRPLPEEGYRRPPMSLQVSAPRTFALVGKLIGCQETVREMYSLLDSSLSMHGVKEQDRARIEGVFAKNGVFARLCDGSLSRADMDRLRFSCLQELDGAQSSRQIINLLFRRFGIRDPDREAIQLGEMRDVHQRNGVGASRPAGPVHELFRGIQAQINKITELLDEGKIELARRFADELVDEQVSRDEGAYASMSLCNLSERAKERGNFSLQLVWAKQATEVAPEDSRAYGHLGEAYLKLGRLEEAKSAFGKAANGGDRIFGAVGIARVLREGPEILSSVEKNGRKGLRSFSVSGRVANPGVYLLPAGSTIRDVIAAAGGMAAGHKLKAYQPGGPSSGLLPASLDDLPLDFDTLQPHGSFIGSAAVVVLSAKDSAREAALNMLRFFEDESCGQCTPCRSGCEKAVKLMQADCWDRELLEDLCQTMADASICGLGQAAPNPIRLTMKHFPEEIQ